MKFILLFFFFLIFNVTSYASKLAKVIKDNTIVYSDVNLDLPIGKLSLGKKLYITDKSFHDGKVIAIIVSKKIAFLKRENLKLIKSKNILSRMFKGTKSNIAINYEFPTSYISNLQLAKKLQVSNFSSQFVGITYKREWNSTSIGFNLESQKLTTPTLNYNIIETGLNFEYFFINKKILQLRSGIGINFAPKFNATYTIDNVDKTGTGFGANLSFLLNFFINKNITISLETKYAQNKIYNMNNINIPSKQSTVSENKFSYLSYVFSISMYL